MQKRSWLVMVLAVFLLGGCARVAPIQSGGASFIGQASLAQRGEQIQRGAATRGWATEPQRPGLIRATLNLRTHQAVVDIAYDTQRFTIQYVSSQNLNEGGGMIHSNYNGWIQYLQQSILVQEIPPEPAPAPSYDRYRR